MTAQVLEHSISKRHETFWYTIYDARAQLTPPLRYTRTRQADASFLYR